MKTHFISYRLDILSVVHRYDLRRQKDLIKKARFINDYGQWADGWRKGGFSNWLSWVLQCWSKIQSFSGTVNCFWFLCHFITLSLLYSGVEDYCLLLHKAAAATRNVLSSLTASLWSSVRWIEIIFWLGGIDCTSYSTAALTCSHLIISHIVVSCIPTQFHPHTPSISSPSLVSTVVKGSVGGLGLQHTMWSVHNPWQSCVPVRSQPGTACIRRFIQ